MVSPPSSAGFSVAGDQLAPSRSTTDPRHWRCSSIQRVTALEEGPERFPRLDDDQVSVAEGADLVRATIEITSSRLISFPV